MALFWSELPSSLPITHLLCAGQWNGTQVAVKVLETLAKADNSDLMEALLGQRISHPNVVSSLSRHASGVCDGARCVGLRSFAKPRSFAKLTSFAKLSGPAPTRGIFSQCRDKLAFFVCFGTAVAAFSDRFRKAGLGDESKNLK